VAPGRREWCRRPRLGSVGRLQGIDGPRKGPLEREANRDPGEIRGVEIKRSDKAADHRRDYDGQAPPDMVANEAPKSHGKEDDGVVQDVGQGHVAGTELQILLQPGGKHGDHGIVDQELASHPHRGREGIPQERRPEDCELGRDRNADQIGQHEGREPGRDDAQQPGGASSLGSSAPARTIGASIFRR
jgi:hypothetical protein